MVTVLLLQQDNAFGVPTMDYSSQDVITLIAGMLDDVLMVINMGGAMGMGPGSR